MPLLTGSALAACAFGNKTLPGSIGPGQTDASRNFTVNGSAILTVSGARTASGAPVQLLVSFPGYCAERVGPTIACTVNANGVVGVVISNPTGQQATYNWVCTGQ